MKLACVELSKKQFEKVHGSVSVFEAGSVPSWWNKFKKNWESRYDEWAEFSWNMFAGSSQHPQAIRAQLNKCLEDDALKVFEFAGAGSQRAAFVDHNGFCLKVGFTSDASEQFEQEEKVLKKLGSRECFPKVLGFSKNCMLCESAETSTHDMWKKMFGISCRNAVEVLKALVLGERPEEAADSEMCKYFGDTPEDLINFARSIFTQKDKKWQVMKQMLEAIKEENAIASDIGHDDNWGLVKRQNDAFMICIDVGLS